jgi:hypothetical protein
MKLHLGCGDKNLSGYLNVDIRDNLLCDHYCDVKTMDGFDANVAEEIYACHVLEHFGRHEYFKVLERWTQILQKNGILKISVPDINAVLKMYNSGYSLKKLWGFIYGGQTYATNYHYVGFDYETLKFDLESLGYHNIRIWDWRETDHSHIDDFSQAYLPHMDKNNGQLMSLNIMAIKK